MKKYFERQREGYMRELKLGICSKCHRKRPIYQIAKRLCSSCRILEGLYSHPERYEKLKRQTIKRYKENPELKKSYNRKYYRTKKGNRKMREYGINYYFYKEMLEK